MRTRIPDPDKAVKAPARAPKARAPSDAALEARFTAEGAPPPGRVAGAAPEMPEPAAADDAPKPAAKPAARTRHAPPTPQGPAARRRHG